MGGFNMKYIICEDECSGMAFFLNLKRIFKCTDCEIISTKGNQKFDSKLKEILGSNKIQTGDDLLLVFDNVANTNKFRPDLIIRYSIEYCRMHNVILWYFNLYCFEEIFLGYSYLIKFYKDCFRHDVGLLAVLVYVNACICHNKNYFNVDLKVLNAIIKKVPDAGKNREHLAAHLLYHITTVFGKSLCIDKGSLGSCWFHDCSSVVMPNKVYNCSICTCFNSLGIMAELDKLYSLESNSPAGLTRIEPSGNRSVVCYSKFFDDLSCGNSSNVELKDVIVNEKNCKDFKSCPVELETNHMLIGDSSNKIEKGISSDSLQILNLW